MMNILTRLEKRYFDRSLSRGFWSLYTGKTLRNTAGVLWGVFWGIFVYDLCQHNLPLTLAYFGLIHLLYGLTVVFGAKFLSRYDFKSGLQASFLFIILYYLVFYFATPSNWSHLFFLSIFLRVLFSLSYWLPYHVDFAKFTDRKTRARQVSILYVVPMILAVIGPLLAGVIITSFGFKLLFVFVIVFLAFSAIPFFMVPKTREKFTWGVFETWKRFFSKKHRKLAAAYAAVGAEGIPGLIIWPIFIYELLKGDYLRVGVLSTLIVGVTIVLQLVLGKRIDLERAERKFLKLGSILYATGWLAKIFISTAFQIFIVGAYHGITELFLRTSFDSLNYELAADNGHYVDEFTVLREIAINLGSAAMCFIAILVSLYFPIQVVFILAALAAVTCNFLSARELAEPISE